jgi:cell division protein FtsB
MHWANRILIAATVAALVAWGPTQLERAAQSDELERVQRERDELAEANRVLADEISGLAAEVRALKSDPDEVARIAREDLNLIAPGEVVFEVERVASAARVPANPP